MREFSKAKKLLLTAVSFIFVFAFSAFCLSETDRLAGADTSDYATATGAYSLLDLSKPSAGNRFIKIANGVYLYRGSGDFGYDMQKGLSTRNDSSSGIIVYAGCDLKISSVTLYNYKPANLCAATTVVTKITDDNYLAIAGGVEDDDKVILSQTAYLTDTTSVATAAQGENVCNTSYILAAGSGYLISIRQDEPNNYWTGITFSAADPVSQPKVAVIADGLEFEVDCGEPLKGLPETVSAELYSDGASLNETATLTALWNEQTLNADDLTIEVTLTTPDGCVFDDGGTEKTVTAKLKLIHNFDDQKQTSVCSVCGKWRKTVCDYAIGLDHTKGLGALTGWSFTGGDNTIDTSALVCYVADAHPTPKGNTSADYLAFSKNAAACATYTLAAQATVGRLEVKLVGGSMEEFVGKIQFISEDGEVVKTETPALTAGNWRENVFVYTDIENVACVKIFGADKWIVMSDFRLSYEVVERTKPVSLTLDVNGGDGLEESVIALFSGDTYTLPTAVKSADGGNKYKFSCWTDGENDFPAGYALTVDEDTRLYAVWTVVKIVTKVECETSEYIMKGGAVELPTAATAYYEGGSTSLSVTFAGEYDAGVSGVYQLTFTVDDMGGLYDLGDLSTFDYTLYVCQYKIISVENFDVSVKVGEDIGLTEAKVICALYVGDIAVGEQCERTLSVAWDTFDKNTVGRYTVSGTLAVTDEWDATGDYTVTANVEVYNFEYSGVKTVLINSSAAFDSLADAGYTVSGAVAFDKGDTDAFLGARLSGGGKVIFTLDKMTHVVLGVSSNKSGASLNFYQEGDLDGTGAQKYLERISSFRRANYRAIDLTLGAGTYVLENGAKGDNGDFSLTYVVIDDGGQEYFIPTAYSFKAPSNTDREDFIGWANGATLYTVGADMPTAAKNKGVILYKAVYRSVNDAFDGLYPDKYAVGWLVDGRYYHDSLDAEIAGEWTRIYLSFEWINGAALRIAGASAVSAEDNSAMKFGGYITFAGGYAAAVINDDILSRLCQNVQLSNLTYTIKTRYAAADKIELIVYIEKIASQGLLKTELNACVTFAGDYYFSSNDFTPEYIAGKAVADITATADGTHKFAAGGKYSYYTDEERAELNKYAAIAAAQSPVDIAVNTLDAENGSGGTGGTQNAGGNMVAEIPSAKRKNNGEL